MNFFDHKDLGNHLLQLFPKVVKHPVLCLSEHLMVEQDLLHLMLDGYCLGSSFYRQNLQRGVCIFVKKINASTKLIFHSTVQNKIWKSVLFN
jgi:hypothetical protein